MTDLFLSLYAHAALTDEDIAALGRTLKEIESLSEVRP